MTNFEFLKAQWRDLGEAAVRAEKLAKADPRAACFYARRSLELAVHWAFAHDRTLCLPYQDNLNALIHEPTFKQAAGNAVFTKARVIQRIGNEAVHSPKPVREAEAVTAVRELFHVCFWLARTYASGARPPDGLAFDPALLPASAPVPPQTQEQLQTLAGELAEKDAKLSELLSGRETMDQELVRLRAEIVEIKKRNAATPDQHNYSEAETRDVFIDLLLKEAGWPLDQVRDREYPVTGMPSGSGDGFVDYVLWGDDAKPLAIVEAKRTKKSAHIGQQQAKLYADCLEQQFGQRPVIFYTNGYEHWLWDDLSYPPRQVQGFYKKRELEQMIQRRTSRKKLTEASINSTIVERYYQTRAIRRINEAFERDHERKALLVMATGAGKTRTVIALCEALMRSNWALRVLFLADRTALVVQAVNAFKKHLPESAPVNLVTERDAEGRVYVSTYPTMMRQIDETKDGQRRFGVGHFDLVVIDEAHRSVYQKYRAIFEYFDSLLVGLTATPKDEVDRDTYGLFDLEKGVPTDAYTLEDAVGDGYLVPPKAVSVPLKFQREGMRYDERPEDEKEKWEETEWDEDGQVPDRVEAEAINKWLFNEDTVDKALKHLMTRGQTVAGGDRLGKTIIFAKNQAHAEYIAQRFDANYPHYHGEFARVIHCNLPYAQSLIDAFSDPNRMPHIAISVDMLDTGIDVPEVVNLVFFKLVRSKAKFWQMLGRGTRLCPNLFGPGQDKEFFYVFDYCQNLEFFSQNPETTEGSVGYSLSKRLFIARLEVIGELDKEGEGSMMVREGPEPVRELRHEVATVLREEVAGMNLENFVVRPHRRLVEHYREAEKWYPLKAEEIEELAHKVAGLPTEMETDDEDAKRFDLLMLNLQLALLRSEPSFNRLRDQVKAIAGLLEEKASVPMVQRELVLIQEIQTDEWWQDVTIFMLDRARKRLRLLIRLIEKGARRLVYTNFEDVMGAETEFVLPGFAAPDSFERFRNKARHFLMEHADHLSIHKLRMNEPLTATDLDELERIFLETGTGSPEHLAKAKEECQGLGLFVRSLVGLDREAAKQAFSEFLVGGTLSANQIQFLDEIVNYLTEHGVMEAGRLYESPYTDFSASGVEGVFTSSQVDRLIQALDRVRDRAMPLAI